MPRTLQDRMRHELTWLWSDPVAATVREAIDTLDARDKLLAEAMGALEQLISDIHEYERINNLAPSHGRQDCWQSVTHARTTLAKLKAALPPAKETST